MLQYGVGPKFWEITDEEKVDEVVIGEGVQEAAVADKGLLSEARCEYLDQLPRVELEKEIKPMQPISTIRTLIKPS